YDYYKQTGGTMLDADGFSQAYTYFGLTTKSTDYAAGFAAYTADYMKGVIAWLETIKSKATDESNNGAVVNSIIDFKQYDANALSGGNFGSDISAFFKFVLNWIFGAGTYAPDVMNAYTPDSSNRAAAEIKSTITNANNIIAFVATQVIDGIAHMALSDIRSLGGVDVVMNQNPLTGNPIADYVPDTLAQAIALNGSNYNMIKLFGLTNAINSSFMNLIYEGIAEVARHAIQYNFFDGMKMAIQNALDGNPVNGNTIYKDITGYDDNNPAAMMDSTSNNDLNLSYLSQASGYAWANKVLTPIIRMAAANALADAAPGSTSKQDNLDATTLISRLVTAKVITADEASQILQNTGHVFTQANQVDSSGNVIGKYSYVRAGAGAAKMFENIYQAEYAAVRNGVADYQANPAISASQIATNQAKITFQSPTDPRDPKNDNHYQDNSQIHNFNLNDYTNVIKYLQSTDAQFNGMTTADGVSVGRTDLNPIETQPVADFQPKFGTSANYSNITNSAQSSTYATKIVRPVYNAAYATEAVKANAAFAAGRAAYLQDLENYFNKKGPVPSTADKSGSAKAPYLYNSDTTAKDYPSLLGATASPATGSSFVAGYGLFLGLIVNYVDQDTGEIKTTDKSYVGPNGNHAGDPITYKADPAYLPEGYAFSTKPMVVDSKFGANGAQGTVYIFNAAGSLSASQSTSASASTSQSMSTSTSVSQSTSTSTSASQSTSTSASASTSTST
ncbi:hypothetical protein, partial [Lacticaseibacillus paracasei]|uniref:hypothetical protein n=1 Tax=Lacticaseibacillus paracasei TaxID=1597 RepID=UPI0031DB61F6